MNRNLLLAMMAIGLGVGGQQPEPSMCAEAPDEQCNTNGYIPSPDLCGWWRPACGFEGLLQGDEEPS